jgi:hypothetical protein
MSAEQSNDIMWALNAVLHELSAPRRLDGAHTDSLVALKNAIAQVRLLPKGEGKITVKARMRASISKFYFQDRVTPVGQVELAAAHHDHDAPALTAEAPVKKPAAKKPVAKKAAPKATAKKPAAKKAAPKKAAPKKK